MKYFKSSLIYPIIFFIILVVAWEILVNTSNIPEFILPAPSSIINSISINYISLLNDIKITAIEALGGFLIANIFSLVIAYLFTYFPFFEKILYPLIISLKSTPVIALSPLMIIWFGYGIESKIVMASIVSFFPLVVNATLGFKNVDENALKLFRTLTRSKIKEFFYLRFPSALPSIFSALKISSTMAVVGSIVAEMFGAQNGIGQTINLASMNLDTPLLFSGIIFASLLGILFFSSIVLLESVLKINRYYNETT
ncbi:MAG: ABC transporter permease [Chitinophagales bacterium]